MTSTAECSTTEIWDKAAAFDFELVTFDDVAASLARDNVDINDLGVFLSPAAASRLDDMASRAKELTERFFSRNIALFYLANHRINHCDYCGYNMSNLIRRARLTHEEIENEAAAIAATGLKEILLLTGESRVRSSVEYIAHSIEIMKRHFEVIGIEVYPMEVDEYKALHRAGADFISVYQETYDPVLYDEVHIRGPKKIYNYRLNANVRALEAGFRGASFAALLGLGDFRRDAMACGIHAFTVNQRFPHAEIGFCVPRLRSYPNRGDQVADVAESELLQVLLAYRLFMPRASISLSTRESAAFRDSCIGLGVTRFSAGVQTGVGGHAEEEKGDEQFHKADNRSVDEMVQAIAAKGGQPIFNARTRIL